MKKVLTVMAAAMIVVHAAAQRKTIRIPPEVNKAFSAQFPTGHLKKWEQQKEEYIATFRQNGKKLSATYTTGGTWEATESVINWTRNLPPAVKAGWNTCSYKDWLILEIRKIVTPEQTLYTLHVGFVQSLGPDDSDIGSEYILFFSAKGELVREERK
jgi:hypothetical protein